MAINGYHRQHLTDLIGFPTGAYRCSRPIYAYWLVSAYDSAKCSLYSPWIYAMPLISLVSVDLYVPICRDQRPQSKSINGLPTLSRPPFPSTEGYIEEFECSVLFIMSCRKQNQNRWWNLESSKVLVSALQQDNAVPEVGRKIPTFLIQKPSGHKTAC
jgi:hypothetical protein